MFILLYGVEWYPLVIYIAIALVFGSAYSYIVLKKIEKDAGLIFKGQETVLNGRDPSMVQMYWTQTFY